MTKRLYSKPVFFEIHHQAVEELAALHYKHAAEKWDRQARERVRVNRLEASEDGFWRGQDRRMG